MSSSGNSPPPPLPPPPQQEPLFLTNFLRLVEFMMVPVLGFSVSMLVYIKSVISKLTERNLGFLIASIVLVSCSTIICFVLLAIYQRAVADPANRGTIRFINRCFYVSGFLGLILSVTTAFIPHKTRDIVGYGAIAIASLFIVKGILQDLIYGNVGNQPDNAGRGGNQPERPMYVTRFLHMIDHMVIPASGFSVALLVYVETAASKKHQVLVVGTLVLVCCSLLLCLYLLITYLKAIEDPSNRRYMRFLKLVLYSSSLLSLGVSSSTAFIPGIGGKMIAWSLVGSASLFILIGTLFQCIRFPDFIHAVYNYLVHPLERPEPTFVTDHMHRFLYFILPMLGSTFTILIYLQKQIHAEKLPKDDWLVKHKPVMYLAGALASCSFISGMALLVFYQRAPVYPHGSMLTNVGKVVLYVGGSSAWGLSSSMASIPDRRIVVAIWVAIAVSMSFSSAFGIFRTRISNALGEAWNSCMGPLAEPAEPPPRGIQLI